MYKQNAREELNADKTITTCFTGGYDFMKQKFYEAPNNFRFAPTIQVKACLEKTDEKEGIAEFNRRRVA